MLNIEYLQIYKTLMNLKKKETLNLVIIYNLFLFTAGLLKIQDVAVADEDKLSRALRVSRLPTYKTRFSNDRLNRGMFFISKLFCFMLLIIVKIITVWHQYAVGEINNFELVEVVAN